MGNIITVNFRGAELYGFEREEGVYVALRPIVEAIGLDWSGQLQRVKRDPILSEGVGIIPIPFGPGGTQDATCLRLDLVNGWLFTIDSTRVRDLAVRERVIVYQRECYAVLARHFLGGEKATGLDHEPRSEESVSVRRMLVTEARHTFDVHAARELWFRLGLPVVPQMTRAAGQPSLFSYFEATKRDPDRDAA